MGKLAQIKADAQQAVWGTNPDDLPAPRRVLVRLLRLVHGIGRDLAEGQLTLRAMSLVYTTLLSLVPLLAFSFSLLKGFGVHNQMEPMLLAMLAPLGEKGQAITTQVIGFVSRMNVGVLGAVGLGMLVYTVISLMQKIEEAFNFVWHVKHRRSLGQRFSGYLSTVLVGPLLMFAAMGVTASMMSSHVLQQIVAIEPFGTLVHLIARAVPYLLVAGAFSFIYVFLPNTRVRMVPAMVGGLTAGVLWETIGWGFGLFVVGSTQYAAIYSTFAILIMFMIWLFVSWLILLVGASVAFYMQHPASLTEAKVPQLVGREREQLALSIMILLARAHMDTGPRWTADRLGDRLGLHLEKVDELLTCLADKGLVTADRQEPPRYLPARAVSTIRVVDLLEAIRLPSARRNHHRPEPVAQVAIQTAEQAAASAIGGQTLAELATTADTEDDPPTPG